ncbi:hypothetical protein C8R44DRAFT_754121 [Mycena epipterygia]|nr:hypothetical protein C8R44DRAFT_754121 [Mycena epipterygia]
MTESKAEVEDTSTTDTANDAGAKITITAACEVGLAAVNAVDQADDALTTHSLATTWIGSHRDGVDITTPFFRDLLADKPIPGANAIGGLADWSERALESTNNKKKASGNTTWAGESPTAHAAFSCHSATPLPAMLEFDSARVPKCVRLACHDAPQPAQIVEVRSASPLHSASTATRPLPTSTATCMLTRVNSDEL